MLGTLLYIVLTTSYGMPGWEAMMCFTGRDQWYRQPRHYFSVCAREESDPKWCEQWNTRFAVSTPSRGSREACLDVIHQNYPNLWRYRNRKLKPIICDFNIEGPPPKGCHP